MYTLFQVVSEKIHEEKELGIFDDFMNAINAAEEKTDIQVFKVCDEKEKCLIGVRSQDLILWRRTEREPRIACGRFKAALHTYISKWLH